MYISIFIYLDAYVHVHMYGFVWDAWLCVRFLHADCPAFLALRPLALGFFALLTLKSKNKGMPPNLILGIFVRQERFIATMLCELLLAQNAEALEPGLPFKYTLLRLLV